MCAGVEKRSQRTSNPSPSFPLSLWISLQRDFPPTVFMKQLVAWAAFAFLHPEGEKEKEKESACCTCMCRSYVTTCPCLTNKHPQYNLLPPAACFIAFLIILCLVYIACEDRHMHNMWFSPGNEEMFHGFKRKHTLQTKKREGTEVTRDFVYTSLPLFAATSLSGFLSDACFWLIYIHSCWSRTGLDIENPHVETLTGWYWLIIHFYRLPGGNWLLYGFISIWRYLIIPREWLHLEKNGCDAFQAICFEVYLNCCKALKLLIWEQILIWTFIWWTPIYFDILGGKKVH